MPRHLPCWDRVPHASPSEEGSKVLSRKAAENQKACQIYDQGVADGASFDQIESSLASVARADHAMDTARR